MGFVPGFDQDVFISYAYVDNQPLYADAKGAGSPTCSRTCRLGSTNTSVGPRTSPSSWTRSWLTTTSSTRRSSGDSRWCHRELQTFASQSDPRFGLQVRGKTRAAKLLVSDLPVEAHPEVMRGVAGYRFVSVQWRSRFTLPDSPAVNT